MTDAIEAHGDAGRSKPHASRSQGRLNARVPGAHHDYIEFGHD
jgi:hypothetical protein